MFTFQAQIAANAVMQAATLLCRVCTGLWLYSLSVQWVCQEPEYFSMASLSLSIHKVCQEAESSARHSYTLQQLTRCATLSAVLQTFKDVLLCRYMLHRESKLILHQKQSKV